MAGVLHAGTSTLIIGNAGSGKTTLLRLFAGRDVLGQSEGSILWNDTPSSAAFSSKLAGFAPGIDVHEPLLTVRETFEFAAASLSCPLSSDASAAERSLRSSLVDYVIDALELRECENVILGNELARGVSGGQKKRVTIGEVLLSGARILSLDEVTNGLDSATAWSIMSFICSWARLTGGTVVAALQAPTLKFSPLSTTSFFYLMVTSFTTAHQLTSISFLPNLGLFDPNIWILPTTLFLCASLLRMLLRHLALFLVR